MKKYAMLLIFTLLVPAIAFAAIQPAAFADIGAGARPAAMGGAFTAVADDANSVFYNPAGMPTLQYKDLTFMYTKQNEIVPYNYAAFVYPFSNERALGVGMIVDGDALLSEETFQLAYAENLGKFLYIVKDFYMGVNLKLQMAGFGNNADGDADRMKGNAWGMGADLGFLWKLNENVSLGAMMKNLLSGINWTSSYMGQAGTYTEGVPMTTEFGFMYRNSRLIFSTDLDNFYRLRLGLEYNLFTYVDLRAGLIQDLNTDSNQEYSVGMGIGHFEFGKEFSVNFDVAYLFEQLSNTLRIQASFKFK